MTFAAGDIVRRVSGAAAWTYTGVFGDRVIRFVVFLTVARIVRPGEFGLVLLSLLAVEAIQALLNVGLPTALLQETAVSKPLLNTAFAINLVMSALAAGTLFLAAGPLASVAGAPAAATLLRVLALTPLIGGLGAVHVALIQRDLGFRALAIRQVASSLVASAIALAMAFGGFGVWALVARTVALALAETIAAWCAAPYRPGPRFDLAAVRSAFVSGLRLWGAGLATMVNARGFDMLAGLALGAVALGALRIAGQTVLLLIETTVGPMTALGFALLARARDDPARFEQTLATLARFAAMLIFPAFAGLYVVADQLLPLMFGNRWAPAAAITPYMCAIAPALYFQLLISAALFAAGRSDRLLHWSAIEAAVTVGLGLAGARFGLVGLAVAGTLRLYLMMPLGWFWLRRDVGINAWRLARPAAASVAAAAVMAAAVSLAKAHLAPLLQPLPLIGALIAVGVVVYGALMALTAGDIWRVLRRERPPDGVEAARISAAP